MTKGAETVEMDSFTFRLSSWAVMKGTESSTASVAALSEIG